MSFQQIINSNFGKVKADLLTIGLTIYNADGTIQSPRTTTGIYQIVVGSGLYAASVIFPDNFHGSVVWDSGEGTNTVYATEEFNYEQRNPKIDSIFSTVANIATNVQFITDVDSGGWKFVNNQMIFFKSDNMTEIARFDLFDPNGQPTMDVVAERRRLPPTILSTTENKDLSNSSGTVGLIGSMRTGEYRDLSNSSGMVGIVGSTRTGEQRDITSLSGMVTSGVISGPANTIEHRDISTAAGSYFDPSMLSPTAWWRADSGVTLTSGRVSNWVDIVNGHSLVQATPSKQPVVDTTALNGMSSIFFDGSGRVLVSADAASTWKFLHDGTGCTIFIVWRSFDVSPPIMMLYDTCGVSSGTPGTGFDVDGTTDNPFVSNATGAFIVNAIGAGSPLPGQTNLLIETVFMTGNAPNDYVVRVGSTLITNVNASGTPSALAPGFTLNVGNDAGIVYPANGYMSEFIIVPRAVTGTEETKMRLYANGLYGT